MDWPDLVFRVLALLLAEQSNERLLIDLLGDPIERGDRVWRLAPSEAYSDALSEVLLHTEDISIGHRAITTVELLLAQAWRVAHEALEKKFGCKLRRVPADPATLKRGGLHRPSPKTFACDIKRDRNDVLLMFTGRPVEVDPNSELDVFEILIRRDYD